MSFYKLTRLLVLLISRSLFAHGLTEMRMGSNLLLGAYLVSIVLLAHESPWLLFAPTLLTCLLYVISRARALLLYVAAVSLIPSSWMALSQLAIELFRGSASLRPLEVFLVAELCSLNAFYALHALNLSELAYILYGVTHSCTAALFSLRVWRSLGLLLREGLEALAAHELKGEPSWKTLAVLMLRSDELADYMVEAQYLKEHVCSPRPLYSSRAVALQTLLVLTSIATLVLGAATPPPSTP